jgi:hypothetical protein
MHLLLSNSLLDDTFNVLCCFSQLQGISVCLNIIILESNSELIFFILVLDYAMKITYVFFLLV